LSDKESTEDTHPGLHNVRADLSRSQYIDERAGRITVAALAERWRADQLHIDSTAIRVEHAAEDGANASEIMRLLGHASLTTSQNYIEVTAAQQRAAVRANRTHRALGALLRGDGELRRP
jgi:site-specific recombinase XerD